jgi:hypothetical protein
MIRPADTLVLFALSELPDSGWTMRSVADRLGVAHPKVQRALERLAHAGLFDPGRKAVRRDAACEFVVHALKYLQPIEEGPLTRGVPTAWAAMPLRELISSDPSDVPVWPDPQGTVRGAGVEPLDPVLPRLIDEWPQVAELAALADGLRLGDGRTQKIAGDLLRDRLGAP